MSNEERLIQWIKIIAIGYGLWWSHQVLHLLKK